MAAKDTKQTAKDNSQTPNAPMRVGDLGEPDGKDWIASAKRSGAGYADACKQTKVYPTPNSGAGKADGTITEGAPRPVMRNPSALPNKPTNN